MYLFGEERRRRTKLLTYYTHAAYVYLWIMYKC